MGILGQVWYLIVSIPDLFRLSYFYLYLPILTMHFVMYMFVASAEFKYPVYLYGIIILKL